MEIGLKVSKMAGIDGRQRGVCRCALSRSSSGFTHVRVSRLDEMQEVWYPFAPRQEIQALPIILNPGCFMRYRHLLAQAVLGTIILAMSGCLSLGGTTYSESPKTTERISSLENRVGVLEQAVSGRPASASMPVPPSR